MKNTAPWIAWIVLTTIILLSTRNPIYLCIILIGLFVVGSILAKKKNQSRWLPQNLRFLLTMVLLSTAINMLFAHAGRTVLFRIPENWILIGGAITLESLIYGAINGLVIASLYLAFNIINMVLSIRQITRLIPRLFYPMTMMATIALTFFPSIQQRAREIKEAQVIRGNPMKKVSDWLPLLVPLMVSSLEKAMVLSESMTTRRFHPQKTSNPSNFSIIGLFLSAFLVFTGWILQLYRYPDYISIFLYITSASIFFLTLFSAGRQIKITHYKKESWKFSDIIATLILSISLTGFLFLSLSDKLTTLSYTSYPLFSMPPIALPMLFLNLIPLLPLVFISYD